MQELLIFKGLNRNQTGALRGRVQTEINPIRVEKVPQTTSPDWSANRNASTPPYADEACPPYRHCQRHRSTCPPNTHDDAANPTDNPIPAARPGKYWGHPGSLPQQPSSPNFPGAFQDRHGHGIGYPMAANSKALRRLAKNDLQYHKETVHALDIFLWV